MFYAHFVLSKKGPLARIWLAAHWDKKLTKAHVFETNIEGSVEAIIQPKANLALRMSGHLLLGVVRIYSRKAKYLLADCNEAFVKIKLAFRPGAVDLPEENREAAMSAITLPEAFHEFDTTMADLSDLDVQAHFTGNQSRPEEITMREDLGNITLVGDDGFGDMGFEGDMMEDDNLDDSLYVKSGSPPSLLLEGSIDPDQDSRQDMEMDLEGQQRHEDVPASSVNDDYEGPAGVDDDESGGDDFGGGDISREDIFGEKYMGDGGGGLFEDPMAVPSDPSGTSVLLGQPSVDPFMQQVATPAPDAVTMRPSYTMLGFDALAAGFPPPEAATPAGGDGLDSIQNDVEAFALKPIDITTIGTERRVRKKRKLVVDEQRAIASETMKLQLSGSSDIVTTLDLAPPTKKLMHWKETGGVEKLFAFPGHALVSKKLSRLFTANLITKSAVEFVEIARDELGLEQPRPEASEIHDHLSAAGDMPELAIATKDAYRPPSTDAPSIVNESSVFVSQTSDICNETDVGKLISEEPVNHVAVQSPPTSPVSSLPHLPPCGRNSDDDDDDDNNDGGFYNDDVSTEADEEEKEEERVEEEEDVMLELVDGEAEEEAEERRWNKRSQQMLHSLTRVLMRRDSVDLKDLVANGNRKHVASKFYTLLVLKKSQAVNIDQAEPYGEIRISKGVAFTAIC